VTQVGDNLPYQSSDALLAPGQVDVYAPSDAGPWPVVVMFHGTPGVQDKEDLREHASRVADLGFVVFSADWGLPPAGSGGPEPVPFATAVNAQAACALAFAAANAAGYGGDASRLIPFGYSGGANVAATAVFNHVRPSAGCLGGTDAVDVSAIVTFEGDFLAAPEFDSVLEEHPEFFDLLTPWKALPNLPDLPIVMLVSERPGPKVEAPMPSDRVAGYLALRDWDGTLARLVAKVRPFEDGITDAGDEQRVMFEGFKENGNPVTLDVLPSSSHMEFSPAGWEVFLAAFGKALAAIG